MLLEDSIYRDMDLLTCYFKGAFDGICGQPSKGWMECLVISFLRSNCAWFGHRTDGMSSSLNVGVVVSWLFKKKNSVLSIITCPRSDPVNIDSHYSI